MVKIRQLYKGVTLAQLVKTPVGQADVQRFEPHLGHNWLSCGVFLVKSRHFGLPLAQTIRPNWQSLLKREYGVLKIKIIFIVVVESYDTAFFWFHLLR